MTIFEQKTTLLNFYHLLKNLSRTIGLEDLELTIRYFG